MPNSLDPDQDQRIIGLGLDPNCLQRLSAGGTSRQTVKLMTLPVNACHLYAGTSQSCEYCELKLWPDNTPTELAFWTK